MKTDAKYIQFDDGRNFYFTSLELKKLKKLYDFDRYLTSNYSYNRFQYKKPFEEFINNRNKNAINRVNDAFKSIVSTFDVKLDSNDSIITINIDSSIKLTETKIKKIKEKMKELEDELNYVVR